VETVAIAIKLPPATVVQWFASTEWVFAVTNATTLRDYTVLTQKTLAPTLNSSAQRLVDVSMQPPSSAALLKRSFA